MRTNIHPLFDLTGQSALVTGGSCSLGGRITGQILAVDRGANAVHGA